jgi:hypothetical protein
VASGLQPCRLCPHLSHQNLAFPLIQNPTPRSPTPRSANSPTQRLPRATPPSLRGHRRKAVRRTVPRPLRHLDRHKIAGHFAEPPEVAEAVALSRRVQPATPTCHVRGEPYVGLAWVLPAMIYTSDISIRNTACMLHGSTEGTGYCDRAESVAPACELRENNSTLMTTRVKHGEARL